MGRITLKMGTACLEARDHRKNAAAEGEGIPGPVDLNHSYVEATKVEEQSRARTMSCPVPSDPMKKYEKKPAPRWVKSRRRIY